jgi:hydrogenase-4 component E|tara:strand:- start:2181 stop:2846 length:666 start_codon:yes stop_codon:yes gene_type:complete
MKDWMDLLYVMDFVSIGILITAISINSLSQIEAWIKAYMINSWLLSLLIFFVAVKNPEHHLYVASTLTFASKGVLLPFFLKSIVKQMKKVQVVETYLSTSLSLIISGIIIAIVYVSLGKGIFVTGFSSFVLKISVAVILIGLFIMITRRSAIAQILGLLFMENGVFLAGFSLTFGMPSIVELGVVFDLLMIVIIMGVFMVQIKQKFSSDVADMDQLTNLKG